MAEAELSEPVIAKDKGGAEQGEDGEDKSAQRFSQNLSNPSRRKGNHNRNWRPKAKQGYVQEDSSGHASDTKPKSRPKPRGKQNAQSHGKTSGEPGQNSEIKGEESKAQAKFREGKSSGTNIEGTASSRNDNWQSSKENPKAQTSHLDNKFRPRSAKSQRFKKSKPATSDENLVSKFGQANQLDVSSTLPCQPASFMNVDTQKHFMKRGIVSDGVYVPKSKLKSNSGQDSQRKQPVNYNSPLNNQTDHQRSRHLPKGSNYSYSVRGASKQVSRDVSKLSAKFQAVGIRSQGQSSLQASVLIEQLTEEKYECMVCCEVIRCSKAVWSCSNCFHIFHLYCIKKWARSPAAVVEDDKGKSCGWRCPACQFVVNIVPNAYKCFCGKVEEPKWYPQDGITPHSCGELCRKKRAAMDCPHPCNQLCHPGPCPSCPATITKNCSCSKTTISVRCGNSSDLTCALVCGKKLNCGVHVCQEKCHAGGCEPCKILQEQSCYCGQSKREAVCGVGSPTYIGGKAGYFSCGAVCSKKLDCGNHECKEICHASNCSSCELKPGVVVFCPCGKVRVAGLLHGKERNSCLDPIPTCGNTCNGFLPCAKYNVVSKGSSEHQCKKLCHHGDCSVCDGDSIVKCRCRATSKKMKCTELNSSGEPYMCERKCNKKFDCGRHRCNQKCCPGTEHTCTLTCGKKLKCGKHKCMEPCHPGSCPPCLMAGFDEVFCPCGATVQEPPIPCGKPPPVCHRLCSRMHSCEHEVTHDCHYEEECPPCTILVSKWCMGNHKQRHNIPCHIDSVSCGERCGKPLPCGKHVCVKGCHTPPCLGEDEQCKQACTSARESCGHPCGAPCHEKECPKTPCKSKVRIFCPCGRKSEDAVCLKGGDKMDVAQAYQRFTTKNLAEKIKGLQGGQTVDISGLMNLDERKSQLDCDDECARQQRNKAFAEALGISRPPETPEVIQYAQFLEEHGRANMKLVYFAEDALDGLITNVAKVQSQQLSHSFAPMNNKNRRFIHELAAMYGCSSISYDQEPNRNTVVTANKDSRCPRVKLSSQLQRQMNPQPPPPVPVLPEQGIGNVKFIERRKSREMTAVDYFADDF